MPTLARFQSFSIHDLYIPYISDNLSVLNDATIIILIIVVVCMKVKVNIVDIFISWIYLYIIKNFENLFSSGIAGKKEGLLVGKIEMV